jgi:hypothetical protein
MGFGERQDSAQTLTHKGAGQAQPSRGPQISESRNSNMAVSPLVGPDSAH